MAPRFSRKKAKYTYTERVLGALSDIQKEHRKHAVHMATLRAHVRKMASDRKDKMGPQWSNWVSRTVQKLADDGILDVSDPHGNVTFTPDAKKTITTVRRESLGPGIASTNLEHKIWKDVKRRFSTIGTKRPRRRLSEVEATDDDNESRPRKRRARRSFSSFTKAELEMELRAALEKLDDAEGPQQADEQEVEILRNELMTREYEVVELRDELARLKDHHSSEKRRVTIGATRLLTPPSTQPPESTSSSTSRAAAVRQSRDHIFGVTRTSSGSLISHLSKRPTPEPSDSGSHDTEIGDVAFGDETEEPLSPKYPDGIQGDFPPVMGDFGLETPQSSPALIDRDDFEVEYEPVEMSDMQHAQRTQQLTEVATLKREIEAQAASLGELRDERQRLLAERDELRASVASRDHRLDALEFDLRCRSDALSLVGKDKVELDAKLKAEIECRQNVQADMEAIQHELNAERERFSVLASDRSSLEGIVQSLRDELQSLTLLSKSVERKLQDAQNRCLELDSARQKSDRELEHSITEVVSLKEELSSTREAFQSIQVALEKSQNSCQQASADLQQTNAILSLTEAELIEARRALESELAVQSTMATEIKRLEGSLKDTQDRLSVTTASSDALDLTVATLRGTVEQLHGELSHAKDQVASTSAQMQESESVIRELRESHAQALSDASASAQEAAVFKATASRLELTLESVRSQLAEAAAEAAGLSARLDMEEVSRRWAESELVAIREARDRLLSDIADKTAKLATTVEELERAKKIGGNAVLQVASLKAERENARVLHAAERSALEGSLVTARTENTDLRTQLDDLHTNLTTLSDALSSASAEKDALLTRLAEEEARASALEEDISVALDDVRDAEEEIQELRQAKAVDETSIQSLKAGLARLRQLQMDALDEVDNKMVSAHTAPTPGHRRRSSIVPRKNGCRQA